MIVSPTIRSNRKTEKEYTNSDAAECLSEPGFFLKYVAEREKLSSPKPSKTGDLRSLIKRNGPAYRGQRFSRIGSEFNVPPGRSRYQ